MRDKYRHREEKQKKPPWEEEPYGPPATTTVEGVVDKVDWFPLDESGRRQFVMEIMSSDREYLSAHLTVVWDDRGRGVPRPGQRFRVTFEPLD